ncbi:hypothetical protein [Sphingobium fuliginis]|uniref:Uncharacterized protein n=1 Tax=Sphingobium fuliginis ATCC 27551 TaxID=1208342 RepID=A0A5B8CJZ8_SPHSA|nr:hypothetical protein [Sphingobium fuliginis]QDC37121.1 hypothetical protein FIL70_07680 [Sphingobium fuliginis ATCC 27551]
MNLRDELLRMGAEYLNGFHSVMPDGLEAEISIVISHKGTVEDSIVIGDHDLSQLLSVLLHVERSACEVLDATADKVVSLGLQDARAVQ